MTAYLDTARSHRSFAAGLWFRRTIASEAASVLWTAGPGHGRTGGGFTISLDAEGFLRSELTGGAGEPLVLPTAVSQNTWTWVRLAADPRHGRVSLYAKEIDPDRELGTAEVALASDWALVPGEFTVAGDASRSPGSMFTGKIEDPRLYGTLADLEAGDPANAIVAWQMGRDFATSQVFDAGPQGCHGVLHNRPTRAVTGHGWTPGSVRYSDAPAEWNAIHFHADDVDDQQWPADFSFTIPEELSSGCYAFRLRQGRSVDHLPFFIAPRGRTGSRVLFVAPTNTYLAYANEHLWEGERGESHARMMDFPIRLDDAERTLRDHPEFGRSVYDSHADGSGVVYASVRRPLLNVRPDHHNWLVGGRRHFGADLFILGWLRRTGIAFDVVTDNEVHRQGRELLGRYDVVVTGSHPEYVTAEHYAAVIDYLDGGGNLMYLGANGFYWVTSYLDEEHSGIEIRRGYAATRDWSSHPAELHHSSTGQLGGAWRHRGIDTNPLLGIGMTGCGFATGSGYTRTDDSYAPDLEWIFDGVTSRILGKHGLVLRAAAGDELDGTDFQRGTPARTRVLATSAHSELYYPAIETQTEIGPRLDGRSNPRVRADMVYVCPQGTRGAVFSAGSIAWAGGLAHNGYDNDLARVATNVLRRFSHAEPHAPSRQRGTRSLGRQWIRAARSRPWHA
ncbi:N,N-dimethylformamidase [Amycolatopsis acidicola]|uniref:N,N-dimethylformamidase n=1 Tax=Amycolatopsis acidicola TaxID=2596893 RepID=A0A5N0VF04_9PSEU|nr:N,N-dimethylformamidase beta subunit family domain-containing protein [Amycolatopsis acidicola]KAA9164024.1 N,N-dimethylformamidase [Amycolatopsis acidicola]